MKLSNMLLKAILALTTFFIGVAATPYFFELFPPKVTLCQLAQNPDFYSGRRVTIEADAVGGAGIIIEDGVCTYPDAWTSVWLAEGYEPESAVQQMYSENVTALSKIYKARILVTGRFDPEATPGCFAPKAAIRATRIELLSEITVDPRQPRVIE
jgi:hypothetical protein